MAAKPGWPRGKRHTEETRRKIARSMMGKSPSAETRAKIKANNFYNRTKRSETELADA